MESLTEQEKIAEQIEKISAQWILENTGKELKSLGEQDPLNQFKDGANWRWQEILKRLTNTK
jgi:hypothetical protein